MKKTIENRINTALARLGETCTVLDYGDGTGEIFADDGSSTRVYNLSELLEEILKEGFDLDDYIKGLSPTNQRLKQLFGDLDISLDEAADIMCELRKHGTATHPRNGRIDLPPEVSTRLQATMQVMLEQFTNCPSVLPYLKGNRHEEG